MKMINFKTPGKKIITMGFLVISFSFSGTKIIFRDVPSRIKITFKNTVVDKPVALNDSVYTNAFDEKYTITKLRYYATNFSVNNALTNFKELNSYHLIDESKEVSQTFSFDIPAGSYESLQFLLGVDSLHNVSGAQTDDLDPTKDMFWTWNTGYVMAKMEGNSSSSKLVNNKYEFHVGGFAGPFNVLKKIRLDFEDGKAVEFKAGKTTGIIVKADINTWWKEPNDLKISEHANITSPGKFALALSDNYAKMFSIQKITSE